MDMDSNGEPVIGVSPPILLRLEPTKFSSGVPIHYDVLGLRDGLIAEIILRNVRMASVWKSRVGGKGRYRGSHRSAEDALAALQNEADGFRVAGSNQKIISAQLLAAIVT